MGKGEIARNEQFLLYPQRFQLNQISVSPFVQIFDIVSLFGIELEEPKTGISAKVLNGIQIHVPGFVSQRVQNTESKIKKMPIPNIFPFSTMFFKIHFPEIVKIVKLV